MTDEVPVVLDGRFVGTWELRSFVVETTAGETEQPFGSNPLGLIVFDDSGLFSVQIAPDSDPAPAETPRPYVAYFGTWSFDPDADELLLMPRGTLNRQLLGIVQRRPYRFEGDTLRLFPPPVSGATVHTTVTWVKREYKGV